MKLPSERNSYRLLNFGQNILFKWDLTEIQGYRGYIEFFAFKMLITFYPNYKLVESQFFIMLAVFSYAGLFAAKTEIAKEPGE